MTANTRPYWWISLALLALGSGLAAIYLGPITALPFVERAPADRNWLRVVYTGVVQPDPQVRLFPVSTHNLFLLSLWEPLVECDPVTGEPQPAAAEGWAWSPDRLTLTLKLRADARWSNGDPVTAGDFVRGWMRLLRSDNDAAYALFPLKNAEAFHRGQLKDQAAVGLRAVDVMTLRLELERPRVTLVAELADPLLAPLHASSEKAFHAHSYQVNPSALVTNGPFHLVEVRGDGYRLAKCPAYHGHDGVRLDGVQFVRAGNASFGGMMIAAGRADLLTPMEPGEESLRWSERPLAIDSEMVLAVTGFYFNVTRGPLRDPRVRRALALALDRAHSVPKAARDQMVPAWSWVPDMPGRKGLKLLHEDADEARRLLAEAGYPGGRGFPVLQIPLPAWMNEDPYAAGCSDRWFTQLGIRTYIAYQAPAIHDRRRRTADYDIIFGSLFATAPDAGDLLSTFQMRANESESRGEDDEVIRLLTEANVKSGAERMALLERGERRAMSEQRAVPLMFARRHVLRAAEVRGWYADPLARQCTRRLWLAAPEATDSPPPSPRL